MVSIERGSLPAAKAAATAAAAAAAASASAAEKASIAAAARAATRVAADDDATCEVILRVWRAALGDPRRLGIFRWLIRTGPKSVGEIVAEFDIPQPNVSQHLAVLREAGLVTTTREDQKIIYHTLKIK